MNRVTRLTAAIALLVAADAAGASSLAIDLPGASIPLDGAGYRAATLTLSAPDGRITQYAVDAGAGRIALADVARLAGEYHYRVDFSGAPRASLAGNGVDGRAANAAPGTPAAAAIEGTFRVDGGRVYVPTQAASRSDAGTTSVAQTTGTNGPAPNDVVTPDNAIIQGSACIGLDCVSGESFGFDTLRLKENNTRIKFLDTSTSTGFANVNWQLTANDSGSGGANKFSIEDTTDATVPFTVLGGAPSNALFIDSTGRVGLGTTTPSLKLHEILSDTPAIRLEQDNSGGFTPQTWDIGANEANFFVRDITGGSRLPFRVRPGAPTSSIDIAASGNVGVGTASPGARLDIESDVALSVPVTVLRVHNTDPSVDASQQDRFVVDSAGNVLARGTLSQLSSRTQKENFRATDGQLLLAKLDKMPVPSWNYRGAPAAERHIGPVAEDFHAAFGLGASERYIAPTDMAGVALASVKALQEQVKVRDAEIEKLEARLRALEARLDATGR